MPELINAYGNRIERGFHSDKNGNLIHIQEVYIEGDIIGTYVPNSSRVPKFRFGNNKKPEDYKTSNLTPIDNVYEFVRNHNWPHKSSWTKQKLDSILVSDTELDVRNGKISV